MMTKKQSNIRKIVNSRNVATSIRPKKKKILLYPDQ